MPSTLTTYDGLLAEWRTPQRIEELVYPENPLTMKLQKNGNAGFMGGDLFISPLIVGNPQGQGGVFATAQANESNLITSKWQITPGDYYGVVQIGDKVLKAARINGGADLDNKRAEIKGMIEQMGDNFDLYCWGNGGGALGQVASISGNDVTLVDKTTIGNFEVGMVCQASTGDGSSTSDTTIAGSEDVSAVNPSTGVITFTDITDFTGTLAVGHYLFRASDFFGNTGNRIVTGVQAYIAATDAPPALNGITAATRATQPHRFAGVRIAAAELGSKSIEDRCEFFLALMSSRFKVRLQGLECFANPEDFYVLQQAMKARGQRDLVRPDTNFGYPTINLNSAAGEIKITSARHCPKGTFFFLRMQDWGLHWIGPELFHNQAQAGGNGDMQMLTLKDSTTDWEYRELCYPVLTCNAPKNSGRLPVTY